MIEIRRMRTEDVDAVAQLEQAIFAQPWSRRGFLDAIQMEHTVFLVAEEDGEIRGYIGMYVSIDEGEITNVAVDAGQRCRGIGETMLRQMLQEAKKRAIAKIVLEVRVSNQSAIRLYERNGFRMLGIRKGFYELPREDAYIMCYGQ